MEPDQSPRQPIRILPTLIIAAVAITAGILAARFVLQSSPPSNGMSALRFPVARALQPFQLVDQAGKPFDNSSLTGYWSFLFFGYTHCPDVCPTTLSVLSSVAQKTGAVNAPTHFVFITVDPDRDTPQQLAVFVHSFNKRFIGVTGSNGAIDRLTKQLGVLHSKVPDSNDPKNYLVDHSASVFLIDPHGKYHALFSPPLSADTMAAQFRRMVADFRP
jgi:protein SCO1/2